MTRPLAHPRRNSSANTCIGRLSSSVILISLSLFLLGFRSSDVAKRFSALGGGVEAGGAGARSAEARSSMLPPQHENATDSFARRQRQNADAKIAERRDWLTRDGEAPWFGNLTAERSWYLFPPVLPCFWTLEKAPGVAEKHDGGKWLCGMQEVHQYRKQESDDYGVGKHYEQQPCIVYSMGSCDKFDFEERVRKLAPGCEIHTFDPTRAESGRGKPFYDGYHGDYGFGGTDSSEGQFPVKSLKSIMGELGHQYVDVLKIDVEGYEWAFLDSVDWNTVRVGQLLMEWHPSTNGKNFFGRNPDAREMNEIFNKLEKAGFYLISLEPVTFTNYGQVEVVFIHKDWHPQGWQSS